MAGLLLGADEYFAKPLLPALFLARARRLIARTFAQPTPGSMLTPRERQVLALLAPASPPKIAPRLEITEKTTATHIEHILRKLGAHSQAQAVAFAVRDHLVEAAT